MRTLNRIPSAVLGIALCAALSIGATPAAAALGDCSQPVSNGAVPSATDCLVILQVSVGIRSCTPEACVCAPKGTLPTSPTDALICLKAATGQQVALNCPCGGGTTTTSTTSTSSTSTSTTTTTTMGSQQGFCPSKGELLLYAGTTGITCTTNADCPVGACDDGTGRCATVTDLDTGWTGIAHNSDINDQVRMSGTLSCPNPFDGQLAEPCGECAVTGLLADNNNCRCSQNNRTLCFDPFALDTASCTVPERACTTNADCKVCSVTTTQACALDTDCPNGEFCFNGLKTPTCSAGQCVGECQCFFGPPLPLSSGNTPACVLNRFSQDVTGTANVDRGAGTIDAKLRAVVYLGELVTIPCPACGGSCDGASGTPGKPCLFDEDCAPGTCTNFDLVAGDGVRDGTCVLGDNAGESCDVDAYNESFPAPGGAGSSLDCAPAAGKNISGIGLVINLTQTTGTVSLDSQLPCYFPFAPELCPCGKCNDASGTPCTSNADCSDGAGVCAAARNATQRQNQCTNSLCEDRGDGTGVCTDGPESLFCDGILRANGVPFVNCLSNADCDATDCGPVSCGACTLSGGRDCFLPAISATGTENPDAPVGASAFCILETANTGINSVAGLPGPGRVLNQSAVTYFCSNDENQIYVPGVGGCQ